MVLEGTLIDRVDAAEPNDGGVTEVGKTEAVMPDGAETDKLTAELNPFKDVTVIVELPVPPCCIVTGLGDEDIEKSDCDSVAGVLMVVIS